METLKEENLSDDMRLILSTARGALKNAYAPYSGIKVGAAVMTSDGTIFRGVNVENSAYGDTICAERGAIMAAFAQGKRNITMVAISMEPLEDVASPCGSCRQMIAEASIVSGRDIKVIMDSPDGVVVASISELLPMAFKLNVEGKDNK